MSMHPTVSKVSLEAPVQGSSELSDVLERIRGGDTRAVEELCESFSTGIRFLLCRRLGPQNFDDKVHDVLIIVREAICNGELWEPERLIAYVHSVVCQAAAHIGSAIHLRRNQIDVESDNGPDLEREAIDRQHLQLAISVVRTLPKRHREALTRFYLNEESTEDICRDMHLSATRFQLIKSRAKSRFGKLGKAHREASC